VATIVFVWVAAAGPRVDRAEIAIEQES